jgi:hypothetical protein
MANDTPMSRRTLPTLAEGNPNAELLRLGQEHDVAFARVLDVNRQPDDTTMPMSAPSVAPRQTWSSQSRTFPRRHGRGSL